MNKRLIKKMKKIRQRFEGKRPTTCRGERIEVKGFPGLKGNMNLEG